MRVDTEAAILRLIRYLSISGITGQEEKIAKGIRDELKAAGIPQKAMFFDEAHTRIPLPTQTGNLIMKMPGNGAMKNAPRLLFMTHMDTVPLCAGAKPKRTGKKIVNEADTALGGDNRTGCAVLTSLAAELVKHKPDHPPITFLFTVREESGLFGARHLDPHVLEGPVMGFNFDGSSASEVTLGAVGADRWEVDILGKAAHAGGHPERGISSTMILALAMARIRSEGWFGKIVRNGHEGTSNIGVVAGKDGKCAGDATNVVTDYVHVKGESRSHDPKFFREITAAYKKAFTDSAAVVKDDEGHGGKVKFTSRTDYHPFRMKENAPVVLRTSSAVESIGLTPVTRVTNGGLDANWMNKHGVPTVTIGAGQNEIHTVKEWVDLVEFSKACELAYVLATMG